MFSSSFHPLDDYFHGLVGSNLKELSLKTDVIEGFF